MTGTLLFLAGALVGLGAGWMLHARRPAADPHAGRLGRVADELSHGRRPAAEATDTAEWHQLIGALERGWAPRNEERASSLQEALGRIAAFLREQVRGPLHHAVHDGSEEALRDGAERALGGLDDLEFFLREPLTPDEVHNLVPLVQQVAREFTADWQITVRLSLDDRPVRAHIHRDTFLDSVYLLLHNAGQFGKGETIDVSVLRDGDRARVVIRDRGPGFSAEALERAHDLFYTTSPSALGLGIPFARKIIESFGGQIQLRNPERGGAEVELALPAA
jgi:signal transduction histidine kinase